MKRIAICVMLLVGIVCFNSVKAEACKYTPNCGASGTSAICLTRHGIPQYTHYIPGDNGYLFICGVTNVVADHDIVCSGCGYVFRTEERTCGIEHSSSYCPNTQYGLCQY